MKRPRAYNPRGRSLHYVLFLFFERMRHLTKKEIYEKLKSKDYQVSQSTVYNYYARWKRADKKFKELTQNF
jgi:hypothetical protein